MNIPEELQLILDIFPLPKPDRIAKSEDDENMVLAEWHRKEGYFEIEFNNGDIVAMAMKDKSCRLWEIKRVTG